MALAAREVLEAQQVPLDLEALPAQSVLADLADLGHPGNPVVKSENVGVPCLMLKCHDITVICMSKEVLTC